MKLREIMKLELNFNFMGSRKTQEITKGILIILLGGIFFAIIILSIVPDIIVRHEPEKFFLGRVTCCLKINDSNFKLEVEKADGKEVVAFSKKMVDIGTVVKVGPGLEINYNSPTDYQPRAVNLPVPENRFYIPGLIPHN